eukprot:scaffold5414_cov40-Tisochrysis_lutea.AAC.4
MGCFDWEGEREEREESQPLGPCEMTADPGGGDCVLRWPARGLRPAPLPSSSHLLFLRLSRLTSILPPPLP